MRYHLYLLFRHWLCLHGLHDDEYSGSDERGWGTLTCFYCGRVKQSRAANGGPT
jgi:hypothetical protein